MVPALSGRSTVCPASIAGARSGSLLSGEQHFSSQRHEQRVDKQEAEN